MGHSAFKFRKAKGNKVMVAIDHLNNAMLIGPARFIAYLETIKLPDQMMVEQIASKAPI